MPEGDTLYRIAAGLGPSLEGAPVLALELPRSDQRTDHLVGRRVERVEARGKNLLIFFDEGTALHTHLRMWGVWHLYREGERWRRPEATASVILAVPGHVAVCFRAAVARLLRASFLRGDALVGGLGPDLLGEQFDAAAALAGLRARGDLSVGAAILDQRAVAGIGNVYKCELLFRLRFDPFAPVRAYSDEELSSLLALARKLLWDNVGRGGPRTTRDSRGRGEGPVSVYGRAGRACYDCGAAIDARRGGEPPRITYFCPRCQPSRGPGRPAR